MITIKNKISFVLAFLFLALISNVSVGFGFITIQLFNRTDVDVVFNPYALRGLYSAKRAMSGDIGKLIFDPSKRQDYAEVLGVGTKNIIVKFASRIDIDEDKEKKRLIVPPKGAIELRFEDAGDWGLCIDPTNLWIQTYKNGVFSIPKKAPLHVVKLDNAEKKRTAYEALEHLNELGKDISERAEDISDETTQAIIAASGVVLTAIPAFFKIFEDKRCESQSYYLYKFPKQDRTGKMVSNYTFVSYE